MADQRFFVFFQSAADFLVFSFAIALVGVFFADGFAFCQSVVQLGDKRLFDIAVQRLKIEIVDGVEQFVGEFHAVLDDDVVDVAVDAFLDGTGDVVLDFFQFQSTVHGRESLQLQFQCVTVESGGVVLDEAVHPVSYLVLERLFVQRYAAEVVGGSVFFELCSLKFNQFGQYAVVGEAYFLFLDFVQFVFVEQAEFQYFVKSAGSQVFFQLAIGFADGSVAIGDQRAGTAVVGFHIGHVVAQSAYHFVGALAIGEVVYHFRNSGEVVGVDIEFCVGVCLHVDGDGELVEREFEYCFAHFGGSHGKHFEGLGVAGFVGIAECVELPEARVGIQRIVQIVAVLQHKGLWHKQYQLQVGDAIAEHHGVGDIVDEVQYVEQVGAASAAAGRCHNPDVHIAGVGFGVGFGALEPAYFGSQFFYYIIIMIIYGDAAQVAEGLCSVVER